MQCWFPGCHYHARSDNVKRHYKTIHATYSQLPSVANSLAEVSHDFSNFALSEVPYQTEASIMMNSNLSCLSDYKMQNCTDHSQGTHYQPIDSRKSSKRSQKKEKTSEEKKAAKVPQ